MDIIYNVTPKHILSPAVMWYVTSTEGNVTFLIIAAEITHTMTVFDLYWQTTHTNIKKYTLDLHLNVQEDFSGEISQWYLQTNLPLVVASPTENVGKSRKLFNHTTPYFTNKDI